MVKELLLRLLADLEKTANNHKKKLIATAILLIGFQIVRKNMHGQRIFEIIMFFLNLWNKITDILPLPVYANYRNISPFSYVQHENLVELSNVLDIKELITSVKNKEVNSRENLTNGVLSALTLNIVLYNANTIYDVILKKYNEDFSDLGAGDQFERSIIELKTQFKENIHNFRIFLYSQLKDEFGAIDGTKLVGVDEIETIIQTFINKLDEKVLNVNNKVLARKTQLEETEEYKVANNYFKTVKEYLPEKPKPKLFTFAKIVFFPVIAMYKGISTIFEEPTMNITNERLDFHENMYVLPIKKLRSEVVWPTIESKCLYEMVIEEITNIFYSINFNIISKKRAELNLMVFINRINIYLKSKVKKDKIKFNDFVGVFYKIYNEEMNDQKRKIEFYDREILNSFKAAQSYSREKPSLQSLQSRNRSLQEIYLANEVEYLEKDMQAKLYHERDGLIIEPLNRNTNFKEKDEIEELMQIQSKADVQKDTTREQMQMMREIIS